MTINHGGEHILEQPVGAVSAGWDEQVAQWVSQVGSPPLVALAGTSLITVTLATPDIWFWGSIYVGLAILGPVLYILWLIRQGQVVADLHLPRREERIKPLLITLIVALLSWALLHLGAAPPLLLILAAANGIQSILFLAITLQWKISLHSATAASVLLLAWTITGPAVLPLAASALLLIGWSRLRLRRHTPAQILAGVLVGSGVMLLALYLYGR